MHTYMPKRQDCIHGGCHGRALLPKSSPAANAVELRGRHRRLNRHWDFATCKKWDGMQGEVVSKAQGSQGSDLSNASPKSVSGQDPRLESADVQPQVRALHKTSKDDKKKSKNHAPVQFHISAALRRVLPTVPPARGFGDSSGLSQKRTKRPL